MQVLNVEALAGLVFLVRNRGRLFPDSTMEDRFPSSLSRPSVPAPVIGSVLVLQSL